MPHTQSQAKIESPLEVRKADHVIGHLGAKITLIQYADFQCPYSAQAAPLIRETIREFRHQVRFVYRNYPLTYLHPYAFVAAYVAEALGKHGLFWVAHELLFREQRNFTPDGIGDMVQSLGVDLEDFEITLHDDSIKSKIEWDTMSGHRMRIEKTPSFLLNGQLYQSEWHESGLKKQIEALL